MSTRPLKHTTTRHLLPIRWLRVTLAAVATAASLALPGAPALAAGAATAYQVEVLIFRNLAPPPVENLAAPAEGRGFGGNLDRGAAPPTLLRNLDVSQMQMGGLAARLRSSGGWQVLAHTGWLQTATDWPRHGGLALEDLGITVPGLSGNFYLERGPQLLHFGMDLHLGENPQWSLSELRKVKFNEKNYFDHPGFGVIAIVSPVLRTVP